MITFLKAAARPIEIFLGVVFLAAAITKVMDANAFLGQMYRYEIMESREILAFGSLLTIFIETGIGAALLFGYRQYFLSFWAMHAMLVFFSVLVYIYWPEECGCFGAYISMGPPSTIGKNVVMLVMGFAAMYGFMQRGEEAPRKGQFLRLAASCVVGVIFMGCAYPQVFSERARPQVATNKPGGEVAPADTDSPEPAQKAETEVAEPGPFAGYEASDAFGETHDLGSGTYLVALLSMTCDHCKASVPDLNNLALVPSHPPMVSLGYEPQEGTLDEFVAETAPVFPITGIGNSFLEFSQLIDKEPPRLALIRDGHVLKAWDEHMPSPEKVARALEKHDAVQSMNN
jgi:uncharacterized membrane protein YphA (DoxX/SURF4 family)